MEPYLLGLFVNLARIAYMNNIIRSQYYSLILLIITLSYSSTLQAKKRCKPFLEKLHKVQAQQRNSYSLKRGQSLRVKEDKARDKWWQCEHMSLAKFKAQNGGKNKKSKKEKKKSNSKYASKKVSEKKPQFHVSKSIATFNQGSAIVVKAKYQGDKRLAWSQFYQRPSKCISPKNLSVFAYCNENKLQQQNQFDQQYTK